MHTHHHAHHPLGTRRFRGRSAGAGLATGLLLAAGAAVPAPAVAVNADHGQQVVSDDPVNVTPHVMNGSVNAVTQIGNKIIAAGTFTSVSPASTFVWVVCLLLHLQLAANGCFYIVCSFQKEP